MRKTLRSKNCLDKLAIISHLLCTVYFMSSFSEIAL